MLFTSSLFACNSVKNKKKKKKIKHVIRNDAIRSEHLTGSAFPLPFFSCPIYIYYHFPFFFSLSLSLSWRPMGECCTASPCALNRHLEWHRFRGRRWRRRRRGLTMDVGFVLSPCAFLQQTTMKYDLYSLPHFSNRRRWLNLRQRLR